MKVHGNHPFGNAKARAIVWNFPDGIPQHREPLWDLGYLGTYSDDRQPVLDRLMLEAAREWSSGGFVVTFLIISAIYWAVPKGHMPLRSVWPGAVFFAFVAALGNYIFPLYLSNISDLHRFGGTVGFVLIALFWFYGISLALLAGAVINSIRHERDDTGVLPVDG